MKIIRPEADEVGLRTDVWLNGHLPDLSRSRIQALLKSGDITIGGESCKPHDKVSPGAVAEIVLPAPEPVGTIPENIPLDVLHEDHDVIVVNKPPGLVVHPAAGHRSGTLVNALLFHCTDLAGVGGEVRPGIVHRLDKDTSGAMVAVKNDRAMAHLVDQFKTGRIHKEYLAVVFGQLSPPTGRVDTLIGRSVNDRKRMSSHPRHGRPAVTHYEVVEQFDGFCLVRVRIETGRTHQIRVHMAHLKHPVLGDRQYAPRRTHCIGGQAVGRQMLHSERLGFTHPSTQREMTFTAPIAGDMAVVLDVLRGGCPEARGRPGSR